MTRGSQVGVDFGLTNVQSFVVVWLLNRNVCFLTERFRGVYQPRSFGLGQSTLAP